MKIAINKKVIKEFMDNKNNCYKLSAVLMFLALLLGGVN